MKEMHEIHQEVFDFLIKEHEKDSTLMFTMRKINRGSRLDKGYWFLGNDHYLAVSFWAATNWKRRTPNIFIRIGIEGDIHLEIATSDSVIKTDFVQNNIIPAIQPLIKEPLEKKINIWNLKESTGGNYIEVLKWFLEEGSFKSKIDGVIKEREHIFQDNRYSDYVGFLNKDEFDIQLKRIKSYQQRKRLKQQGSGYLKSFYIKKFQAIRNEVKVDDITDNCRWIVFTGENGSGKTSILKALGTGFTNSKELAKLSKFDDEYGDYKISIELSRWNKGVDKFVTTPSSSSSEKDFVSNGFASYGAIRLINEGSMEAGALSQIKDADKFLTYGLFKPIGILKDMSKFELSKKSKENIEFHKAVIENLKEIIPNLAYITEQMNDKLLFHQIIGESIDKGGVSFDRLPSGTRSFVGLVLDLLIRFKEQQPEVTDPGDFNGVVIIDEIDIHLHPKMQVEFVKQLSETFPKIQFIVSTHSPVPLLGMPKNSVFCKVCMDYEKGVIVERLEDIEANFKFLLPNALLTSDLFDFEGIIHDKIKAEEVSTFDSYEKHKIDNELTEQLDILKEKDIELYNDII